MFIDLITNEEKISQLENYYKRVTQTGIKKIKDSKKDYSAMCVGLSYNECMKLRLKIYAKILDECELKTNKIRKEVKRINEESKILLEKIGKIENF